MVAVWLVRQQQWIIRPFGLAELDHTLLLGDVLLIEWRPGLLHSSQRGAYWQVRMIRRGLTFALMMNRESKAAELGASTMVVQPFAPRVAVGQNEARELRMPVTFTRLKSAM